MHPSLAIVAKMREKEKVVASATVRLLSANDESAKIRRDMTGAMNKGSRDGSRIARTSTTSILELLQ